MYHWHTEKMQELVKYVLSPIQGIEWQCHYNEIIINKKINIQIMRRHGRITGCITINCINIKAKV